MQNCGQAAIRFQFAFEDRHQHVGVDRDPDPCLHQIGLIHLKNSSTCQRDLYNPATVSAGIVKLFVRKTKLEAVEERGDVRQPRRRQRAEDDRTELALPPPEPSPSMVASPNLAASGEQRSGA